MICVGIHGVIRLITCSWFVMCVCVCMCAVCALVAGMKTREGEEQEDDDDDNEGNINNGTATTTTATTTTNTTNNNNNNLLLMTTFIGASVSLQMVLCFFTSADSIPPLGMKAATLNFNPKIVFPTASTCAIELTLPTALKSYEELKKNADIAFSMHGGFGLI